MMTVDQVQQEIVFRRSYYHYYRPDQSAVVGEASSVARLVVPERRVMRLEDMAYTAYDAPAHADNETVEDASYFQISVEIERCDEQRSREPVDLGWLKPAGRYYVLLPGDAVTVTVTLLRLPALGRRAIVETRLNGVLMPYDPDHVEALAGA